MSMQGGDKMELGKQIKMHRQELHLSQEELANRIYVSRQTVSNWENDKNTPFFIQPFIFLRQSGSVVKNHVCNFSRLTNW